MYTYNHYTCILLLLDLTYKTEDPLQHQNEIQHLFMAYIIEQHPQIIYICTKKDTGFNKQIKGDKAHSHKTINN